MEGMATGDCGVCIGGDYGEYADVFDSAIVKARKSHTCEECDKEIKPGEQYERTSMLYDGSWSRMSVCLICAEIGIAFSCDGRMIGNMWEDIQDNMFPVMTTGCLAKLRTAAAKQHLVNKWNEWKFGR